MTGNINAESCGIAVIGTRAALLREDSLLLGNGADQRLLHSAVGGEERGVDAILLDVLGNVLNDPLLCTGNAGITGRVGSGSFYILNAKLLTGLLEQLAACCDCSIREVTGKGDVNEGLGTLLLSLLDNCCALRDLIGEHADVSLGSDDCGILCANAADEKHIGTSLTNLVNSGSSTGNGLNEYYCLNVGVGCKTYDLSDGCLGLGGEVVRICSGDYLLRTKFLEHILSSLIFFFALGNGAGDDTDLVIGGSFTVYRSLGFVFTCGIFCGLSATACAKSEYHNKSQEQAN